MKLRHTIPDRVAGFVRDWSLPRQFAGGDPTREAAQSTMSRQLRLRLEEADTIGTSICPIARSGALSWFMPKDGHVIHIEGDPRSPINQGTWLTSPERLSKGLYRAPRLGDGPDRLSRQAHTGRDFCTRSARRHAGQSHAGNRLARGRYPRQ